MIKYEKYRKSQWYVYNLYLNGVIVGEFPTMKIAKQWREKLKND